MKFSYKGITKDRRTVEGEISAGDVHEAKIKLRALRIRPNSLEELEKVVKRADKTDIIGRLNEINIGPPVNGKQMLIFTRQFSSLIDAGVPVVQCLDLLASQAPTPPFKRILFEVKLNIEQGESLAASMAKHPSAFNSLMVSLIEAGEISGTLDKTLRRIGIQFEKTEAIKKKVRGAMLYPCFTMIIAIGVLCFLLVKVIPDIAEMYGSRDELPELTRQVLTFSDWIQLHYMLILYGIGAFIAGFMFLYRINAVREVIDPIILRIPLFGPLVIKSTIARMSRTLSTLIASGVPLLGSFTIVTKLVNNLSLKHILENTAKGVSEGKSIAHGLDKGKIFPKMVVHMVSIGEVSGKLDELMGKVAEIYEEEVDEAISTMTGLIQPIMIVGVGIIIAFLLVAMYMPIFSLADKIAG